MVTLVVSADPSAAGEFCVARYIGSSSKSYFDSHGKARLRVPPNTRVMVNYKNTTQAVDMGRVDRSMGKNNLTTEDREYLAWLEMSAEDKYDAIVEDLPIAKWSLGAKVSK